MQKKTIADLPADALNGRKVLVRVDYNVPLENGSISDDTRITATLPTLRYLLDKNAAVILVSHLGRPKAKRNDAMSLAPVAKRLAELLDKPVQFTTDITGDEAQQKVAALRPGQVLLLENVRFLPGEEANDPALSQQ